MPYQLLPTKLYARHQHKQQCGDGKENTVLASSQNPTLVSGCLVQAWLPCGDENFCSSFKNRTRVSA